MRINYLYPLYHLRINNLSPLYQMGVRVINKLLSLPSDIAAKVHSVDWFERSILLPQYQQYLTHYKNHIPELNASELAIAEQIDREGICITSLDTLDIPNTQSLLKAAQQITSELAQQSRSPEHAHKHTLMATAEQLLAHPEIFFWGLSERILKIVGRYLDLPVAYDGLAFYYSVADGRDHANKLPISPNNFHCIFKNTSPGEVAIQVSGDISQKITCGLRTGESTLLPVLSLY